MGMESSQQSLSSNAFTKRTTVSPTPCNPYAQNLFARTIFYLNSAVLFAHPSLGGLIVLDPVYIPDLIHLGIDLLDPPLTSSLLYTEPCWTTTGVATDADGNVTFADPQAEEDDFARRLLALGAKWYDSEARYRLLKDIESAGTCDRDQVGGHIDQPLKANEQSAPTKQEKMIVRVGFPSTGGIWIAEYDTPLGNEDKEGNIVPLKVEGAGDAEEDGLEWARLALTTTMVQKCQLLRDRFGAKFYRSLDEYEGNGYFKLGNGRVLRREMERSGGY